MRVISGARPAPALAMATSDARAQFEKPNAAFRGSWAKLFRIAAAPMARSPPTAVFAQHASDDPLATANDAFGLTLGLESIGLYGPGLVRGL